eukprot:34070_5
MMSRYLVLFGKSERQGYQEAHFQTATSSLDSILIESTRCSAYSLRGTLRAQGFRLKGFAFSPPLILIHP